jgi:hypothetical protein
MDSIELIGYPIKVSNSTIFKKSFITFVTPIGVIDVKINCLLENYKYEKYIDYTHLCQFYLVKTRENWILKDFQKAEKIFILNTYEDYQKLADTIFILQKNLKKIDENFLPLIHDISINFNLWDLNNIQRLIQKYI